MEQALARVCRRAERCVGRPGHLRSPHEVEALGTVRLFEAGEGLYAPGDQRSTVFVLTRGLVRIERQVNDDRRFVVRVARRGDLIGVGAGVHRDYAIPITDALVRVVPYPVLLSSVAQQPLVARAVTAKLAEQLQQVEQRMAGLLFGSVQERLASVLVDLAAEVGREAEDGVRIEARLTHRDLASLIGATRETVSTSLIRLRREGLIRQDARRFLLPDPSALAALAYPDAER